MRIGLVLPWIHGIGGNKTVFSLASELSVQGHDVEVLCLQINSDLVSEAQSMLGGALLSYREQTRRGSAGRLHELQWQLLPFNDWRVARLVHASHRRRPFDVVLLVANEGRRLAQLTKGKLGDPEPLLGWSLMELIDHSYLLRRERDYPAARSLLGLAYVPVHWVWAQSIASFDFLCANSGWTRDLAEYLYEVRCGHVLISLPSTAFVAPAQPTRGSGAPYVVAPTASLGPREAKLLKDVARSGLRVLTFGPQTVPEIESLGFLPEDEMRRVVFGAAVTLFLFDYEGLGLIPFESLALGTPVVTLPKSAVYQQWREHPFVTFADDASGLISACTKWVGKPPSPEVRRDVSASVRRFEAPQASRELLKFLSREIAEGHGRRAHARSGRLPRTD